MAWRLKDSSTLEYGATSRCTRMATGMRRESAWSVSRVSHYCICQGETVIEMHMLAPVT